ncbi:MAG: phosphoethanolamine transferase CptA [Gammaproteobacteria bacterium]|nr:MAG: phosphoethanolamine transferase CptA [Gammaproteobacteria bacterium]
MKKWIDMRQWPQLLKVYVFFIWFSGVTQLLLLAAGKVSAVGLKNVLIYNVLWLLVPVWMHRWTRHWMVLAGSVLFLCGALSFGYYLMYGQELSQSIFYVIFESNLQEGSEFFRSYLRAWMIPLFLLYLLVPVLLWRAVQPLPASGKQKVVLAVFVVIAVAEPFVSHKSLAQGWNALVDRQAVVAPWNMLIHYEDYQENMASINRTLDNLSRIDVGPVNSTDLSAEQTYVLVIGESTNRQRMGIYGYARDTTPQLSALADELMVFGDVNAAIPYTIESITSAFYFSDRHQVSKAYNREANLLMLMKQMGFSIFWITNQQTITHRNTLLTTFSKMADKAWYLNNNRLQSARQLDEDVFAPFQQALAEPAPRKLIVVHLLGTHFSYQFRYPENFARFTGEPPTTVALSSSEKATYNEYDNAVLYNDFVVSSLIRQFRDSQSYGALLYFSDHGEEVFDNGHFSGRNALDPTSAMYTVPFLVWGSEGWKQAHQAGRWQQWLDRPFSLDDFVYAWCDLVAMDYDRCDANKSLFNPGFRRDAEWRVHPWVASKQQMVKSLPVLPGPPQA